jgi:hypothetical protein
MTARARAAIAGKDNTATEVEGRRSPQPPSTAHRPKKTSAETSEEAVAAAVTLTLLDFIAAGCTYGPTLHAAGVDPGSAVRELGARRHWWRHEIVADCADGVGKAPLGWAPPPPPWGG